MAASQNEKSGLVWSLVSWGAAIVAALVIGWIAAKIFGETAAGLAFGCIGFVVVGWILSQRLGPPAVDEAPPQPFLPAEPVAAAAVAAPVAPVAAPAHVPEGPAPEAGGISQRVRDAARAAGEAARAAVGDVAPAPSPGAVRPASLVAPAEGGPDDLTRIKGIGPKFAEMLHGKGIYHFSQIAAWGPDEIAWIEANIEGLGGRVVRDDWVGQAKILVAGGETEHSQRVDRGEST